MEYVFQREGLLERIYWIIRLRWIAITGVIFAVLFSRWLRVSLSAGALYSIVIFLGIYNLSSFIYLNQVRRRNLKDHNRIANRIANTQISFDLVCLTGLIHFSGGIENPFIFYFIFHMIIASILLSRRASYLQATFAVFLFCFVVSMEYFGFINHYFLQGFMTYQLYTDMTYILGSSFVFISTLYLSVYMASSISAQLRQREKSLKEANILLEEKDRIKSEYVLRVSHDIKEHLCAIQSCIEPVFKGITGELNKGQADLLKRAGQRTDKLLFFVRALLEITRIKLSKQVEMQKFSLREAIKGAMGMVEARAKSKGLSISLEVAGNIDIITGAQIYIEETIANLLANSIKYTPANGKIKLSVEDKVDSILIKVADSGIGIPKDEISGIFGEFYRASNAKALERTGTGLGLAIARQVVERHKGKIWVESEVNKGSTFYMLLPKDA